MPPWLTSFRNAVLRALQEFFVALLRLLSLLLVFIPVLLLKLVEWLLWLWRTTNLYEEEIEEECGRIPETLIRRPDPCLYSQWYLAAQGLPVTWNNPDIWIAPASDPTAIEPDSYHLKADTDYIVSVQAHNASTDAAIGVKVRLVYRPWSFNSPDLVPVETDANGNEVLKTVDIPPMGAAIAHFNWHTPQVGPGQQGHYCLQVQLLHPLDTNPANNVGQENTNVYSQNPGSVTPGEIAELVVPLFNAGRRTQVTQFRWDIYSINLDDSAELQLRLTHGKAQMPLSDRLGHMLPTVNPSNEQPSPPSPEIEAARATTAARVSPAFGKVEFGTPKSLFRIAKTKYVGFEALREQILSRDYSLPSGMQVTIEGIDDEGVRLEPQEMRVPRFTIKVPDDATPGTQLPVNVIAETAAGGLVGGITLIFQVEA